jgi:hypothetical protein
MTDVTQILCAIEAGDPKAASELLPLDEQIVQLDEALTRLTGPDRKRQSWSRCVSSRA